MCNKKSRAHFLVSILMIFLLSACSQKQQEQLITPTSIKNTSPTPQILPTATKTARSAQITPTQTLTPTLQPKAICPVLNNQLEIVEEETELQIEQAILDYLNHGGPAERLQDEIKKLQDKDILGPSQVIMVDIDSDEIKEIAIDINFGPPQGGSYLDIHDNLYIYSCVDGRYEVKKIIEGEGAESLDILTIENVLGTENAEIMIARRWSYLGGYSELVEIFTRNEAGWISAFRSDESPCGVQTEIKNGQNDHKQLTIEGNQECFNSAGERIGGERWIYAFDEDEVKLIEELSPSP